VNQLIAAIEITQVLWQVISELGTFSTDIIAQVMWLATSDLTDFKIIAQVLW
jgi:hypothetical protein